MIPRFKVGDLVAIRAAAGIHKIGERKDYGKIYLLVAYHSTAGYRWNPNGIHPMPYYDILLEDSLVRRGLEFINDNCELLEEFDV